MIQMGCDPRWTFLDFHMESPCGNPKMSIGEWVILSCNVLLSDNNDFGKYMIAMLVELNIPSFP